MNTAELIYQEVLELPEYARLEMLKNIQLTKEKLGFFKKPKPVSLPIESDNDKSEQAIAILESIVKRKEMLDTNINTTQERLNFLNNLASQAKTVGFTIDMDDFEKSRQDRELDR